jgi:hypothetical protein
MDIIFIGLKLALGASVFLFVLWLALSVASDLYDILFNY